MKKIFLILSLATLFASVAEEQKVITDPEKLREITKAYRTDKSRPKDFVAQGDGTVIDNRTGLQWMQCSLGQTWEKTEKGTYRCSGYLGIGGEKNFEQANQSLKYASYSDWRLPTKWELETLVYCGGGEVNTNISKDEAFENCDGDFSEPVIAKAIFPNTAEDWYVTSTPSIERDSYMAVVNFSIGNGSTYSKGSTFQVRLVRQP